MRILAIECATEACSAALFDNGALLAGTCETIGRGHAERLVPMIAELPDKGRAASILVSLGPGSFTGVRIGLAVARALGVAWGASVKGYPTLALVAAMAQREREGAITVCMTGGHGEWFVQDFGSDGLPRAALASLAPTDAARHLGQADTGAVAGSKAQELAGLVATASPAYAILPDARHALAVPATLWRSNLAPIYGRAPDARLPGSAA